ncbi:hypothetical protein B0H11DRAFT_2220582 [Mycena galericulata]|nr:hypothetical protein B0H11DRAFT_2220582 [Mycena galericulata]
MILSKIEQQPIPSGVIRTQIMYMLRERKPVKPSPCLPCLYNGSHCTFTRIGRECKECEVSLNLQCNFATFETVCKYFEPEDELAIVGLKTIPDWRKKIQYEHWFTLYPYVEAFIEECRAKNIEETAAAYRNIFSVLEPVSFKSLARILQSQYYNSPLLTRLVDEVVDRNDERDPVRDHNYHAITVPRHLLTAPIEEDEGEYPKDRIMEEDAEESTVDPSLL